MKLFFKTLGILFTEAVQQIGPVLGLILGGLIAFLAYMLGESLLPEIADTEPLFLSAKSNVATIIAVSVSVVAVSTTLLATFRVLTERTAGTPHLVSSGIRSFHQELKQLRSTVETMQGLDTEEKENLVASLKEEVRGHVSDDFVASMEERFGEQGVRDATLKLVRQSMEKSRLRIESEVNILTKRGVFNLLIGLVVTAVAVAILAAPMWKGTIPEEAAALTAWFVPRVTLTILIGTSSFFFLKLYSASLRDIKYYQNELTNLECKQLVIEGATLVDDPEVLKAALADFTKTERNFVLKKDETTVDLEKAKLDQQYLRDALNAVLESSRTQNQQERARS